MKLVVLEPMIYSRVCRLFKFNRKNDKSYYYEKIKKSEVPDFDDVEKRCAKKTVMAVVDEVHLEKIKEFNARKNKLYFDYCDAEKELELEFKEFLKGINIDD